MADRGSSQIIDFEAVLADRLTSQSLVDDDALERAVRLASQEGKKLWHVLPKLGLVGEARLAEEMAKALNLPLAGADDFPDNPVASERISVRFLREFKSALIGESDGVVQVAIADPDNEYAIKAIKQALGGPICLHLATPTEIASALDRWFGDGQSSMARIGDHADTAHLINEDLEELRDHASEAPVVQLVNLIIERAIDLGASDIHLQPEGRTMSLRYRVDGVLMPAESPPSRMRDAIVSCIKLMGGLDIAERRLPQDGRIKLPVRGIPVDIRISAMPSLEGEGLVLRLLDRSNVELKLDSLGFGPDAVDRIGHMVRQPNGIVLVTGPTGSGKTTTLYAILETINQSDRKILTVEDPVEYQIAGVLQTQVQSGINLGFAEVLRSSLRHDPDVIMVGEIRDIETAEIAVQASLTGHLVFSTLHTNSAPASTTRLVDMGIKPYLLGATMRGVISQRLVRQLCPTCKQEAEISADRLGWVLDSDQQGQKTFRVWQATGCEECGQTGYNGRTVIYEIMDVAETVQAAITRFEGEKDIAVAATDAGYRPLAACGFDKVLAGITSVEEIMRVSLEA